MKNKSKMYYGYCLRFNVPTWTRFHLTQLTHFTSFNSYREIRKYVKLTLTDNRENTKVSWIIIKCNSRCCRYALVLQNYGPSGIYFFFINIFLRCTTNNFFFLIRVRKMYDIKYIILAQCEKRPLYTSLLYVRMQKGQKF